MKHLFEKLLNNSISKVEFDRLMEYVKNSENANQVKAIIGEHLEDKNITQSDLNAKDKVRAEKLYKNLSQAIDEKETTMATVKKHTTSRRFESRHIFRFAASIVILFGFYFLYQNLFNSNHLVSVPKNEISLELGSGEIQPIIEGGDLKLINTSGVVMVEQQGLKLTYSSTSDLKDITYNTLRVPYGKKVEIGLSDGTQVHLNAGTTLRYPVQFISGEKRKVFLKGEAYFDVAKDEKHPFIVNANDIDLEVLGTEFNMSYYPEDEQISTVLVEGAVQLHETSNGVLKDTYKLSPGFKASWSKTHKRMAIEKVDTEPYTAWVEGRLMYRSATFKTIRKKLERHFNIKIENHHKLLDNQVYSASFKNETIEEILEAFNEDTPFEYIKQGDKKIIITNTTTN